MVRITSPLSRILVATAALSLLAGCAGGNSSADLSPAAPQQAEAPPPQPSQSPAPSRPAPAGRNTQAAAPPAPPEPDVVLTPEKIKADCWMKFENDKKIKNVDARLALVEKCVDETSRRLPPQR
jgi:hypothetical protein